MISRVKNHLSQNYLLYLIFLVMFFLVLIALQNNEINNSGLSQKQRYEVNEMIKNAESPNDNRKLIVFLVGLVIIGMILLYNFVLIKDMKKHEGILKRVNRQKQKNTKQGQI